jgi:hypothetical protein
LHGDLVSIERANAKLLGKTRFSLFVRAKIVKVLTLFSVENLWTDGANAGRCGSSGDLTILVVELRFCKWRIGYGVPGCWRTAYDQESKNCRFDARAKGAWKVPSGLARRRTQVA